MIFSTLFSLAWVRGISRLIWLGAALYAGPLVADLIGPRSWFQSLTGNGPLIVAPAWIAEWVQFGIISIVVWIMTEVFNYLISFVRSRIPGVPLL